MSRSRCRLFVLIILGSCALLSADWSARHWIPSAIAQQPEAFPTLGVLDQFGPLGPGPSGSGRELSLSATYQIVQGGLAGRLSVQADLAPGWHVYSLTQQPGGPQASELEVARSEAFQVTGPFVADVPPNIKFYEGIWNVPAEEHAGRVTWTAPIRVAEGVAVDELAITVTFSGQVCQDDGVCIPIDGRPVAATFAGRYEPPAAEIRIKATHVTWKGAVGPAVAAPGQTIQISLQAVPDPGWHVYAQESTDPKLLTKPTLITVSPPAGWQAGPATTESESTREETGLEEQPISQYHEGPVTWTVDVQVPVEAEAGEYPLQGAIGFQTCTASQCDLPAAVEFTATVTIASQPADSASQPLAFAAGSYAQVAKRVDAIGAEPPAAPPDPAVDASAAQLDLDRLETQGNRQDLPVAGVLVTAFVAGFLLNFMPCVLPVIGLKVMAFVQQAGDSRGRIFLLNVWYSAGLMSVFIVLATLAVVMGLNWGEQFSIAGFNIVLAAVLFAFALSFLGVWEIPLPGFVGSGKMNDLASQEGASGAFFKGVLTTILATPCSGPMLSPALTWAVSQPALLAYAGFASVGLGMASPYLLIGAFPRLVGFLPKPGPWMETFKHMMGFIMLGTVVFLLTFMPLPLVVPTVAFLIGIWAALWWVGRIPITAHFQSKLRGWLVAGAFATLVGLYAFTSLAAIMESRFLRAVDEIQVRRGSQPPTVARSDPGSDELPWQPFSLAALQQYTDAQYTVFVDFTADW